MLMEKYVSENIFLALSNWKLKISGLQTLKMKQRFWIRIWQKLIHIFV